MSCLPTRALALAAHLVVITAASGTANASGWAYASNWQRCPCYQGLAWQLWIQHPTTPTARTQIARFVVRNGYRRRVWFNYVFSVNGQTIVGRTHVDGGTSGGQGTWMTIPVASSFAYDGRFERVKFSGSWGGRYPNCDRSR